MQVTLILLRRSAVPHNTHKNITTIYTQRRTLYQLFYPIWRRKVSAQSVRRRIVVKALLSVVRFISWDHGVGKFFRSLKRTSISGYLSLRIFKSFFRHPD